MSKVNNTNIAQQKTTAVVEKAKLHDTVHRLKLLATHVEKKDRADTSHLAKTAGL